MRLPENDSVVGRGLKTAVQAIIGFLFGLVVVVWNVPGVPQAVIKYTQENIWGVLLLVGIPSGLVSIAWNYFRRDIPTY